MGPVSAVRPVVQVLGQSGQSSAGASSGAAVSTGTAAQNGGRSLSATPLETARPVLASEGSARSSEHHADHSYLVEMARERAESAHRAYTMTMLALGQNPLSDPIP